MGWFFAISIFFCIFAAGLRSIIMKAMDKKEYLENRKLIYKTINVINYSETDIPVTPDRLIKKLMDAKGKLPEDAKDVSVQVEEDDSYDEWAMQLEFQAYENEDEYKERLAREEDRKVLSYLSVKSTIEKRLGDVIKALNELGYTVSKKK